MYDEVIELVIFLYYIASWVAISRNFFKTINFYV
jgi:hypothetical protein